MASSNDASEQVNRSVLVVDDEENFLTLLRWFLTERGYDVITAASVEEALNLASTRGFRVALLDVKIGSGDGIALLEQLMKRLPGLKVIMMTAYPTVASIRQALDRGAVRYLTKPVNLPDLAQTIEEVC